MKHKVEQRFERILLKFILIPMLVIGIGAMCYFTYFSSLDHYPDDVTWWRGTVANNFVWLDGDQDILTTDGHYVVDDILPVTLFPGDAFYLLQAGNSQGQQLTFICVERKRNTCGALSLAINPPFKAKTLNQGEVPFSARDMSSIQLLGNEKFGHYAKRDETMTLRSNSLEPNLPNRSPHQ